MKFDVSDLQRSSEYDYDGYQEFQSELAHRLKTFGVPDFLTRFCTQDFFQAVREKGMHCACYFLSFIDYICNQAGIKPDLSVLGDISEFVMPDFLLYSEGCSLLYTDLGDAEYAEECLACAIPEFLSRNLVVTLEAFDIV